MAVEANSSHELLCIIAGSGIVTAKYVYFKNIETLNGDCIELLHLIVYIFPELRPDSNPYMQIMSPNSFGYSQVLVPSLAHLTS